MGFLRNRATRRFPVVGLLSDLALVGAAASRLARRRGATDRAGAMSGVEMALAGGAALRLVRRVVQRRRRRGAGAVERT